MAGRRALRWLLRRDPGLGACRRALRVGVVATVVFMVCRYGFGSPTAATYAVFGTIGFGVLSQVVGTPRQRTRTLVGCLVAGTVLLTIGTLLAGSTLLASVGMLVVGVSVAFIAVGGPRLAGVANGLQLVYILPSFPPFAPETLPARVLGFVFGVGLLLLADRVLWPPRPVRSYACRAASAARALAGLLEATGAGDADAVPARRAAATRAAGRLKLLATPWEVRPTGPGIEDRSLAHLGGALRGMHGRVDALLSVDARGIPVDAAATLATLATTLHRTADALLGRGPVPEVADLDAERLAYTQRRLDTISALVDDDATVAHARAAVAVGQALSAARVAVQSAEIVVDPRGPRSPGAAELSWWATAPTALLWWRRIHAHLSLRSVYLQNALRLGVGLALARLVAGGLDLSHGLWVLLATLTLMRTSVTSTRATLLPAIVGTALGAGLAAGLLALAGPETVVYAALFPLLCVVAVAAGQVFGMIAGQASFTVLVAVLFAQLSPAGPSLAGVRFLDVAVGAAVGIGVGAAVWPAGGHGEVRRDAARCLRETAALVAASSSWLAGTGSREDVAARLQPAEHWLLLFEATFLQYRSERRARHEGDVDWFVVLGVVHRAVRTARTSLGDLDPASSWLPDRWPDLVARLRDDAQALADGYAGVARSLAEGRTPAAVLAVPADFLDSALRALAAAPGRREHPRETLRLADAWGRLGWLADDLAALGVVLAPVCSSPPAPARSARRRRPLPA
ncbi:FUSC family protein [Actinomycetospora lutea]|uniref:FUSC family protein n=1 Tax=Actinomycetospora lutea TaxID=663604 RepID=UPI0023657D31|nr:FUSC family protein [Actinomycetospora lutea]MDD7937627.1 FUSC family protein [Actinomycetospora lutea]